MAQEKQPEMKEKVRKKSMESIIRFVDTNIDGNKEVVNGLRLIKGLSFSLANAIVKKSNLKGKKFRDLTEDEQKNLEEIILTIQESDFPKWMLNRRFDPETGNDAHLVGSRLQLQTTNDINAMKKLRTYRGIRHIQGLPVRGQRTRSSFRKSGKAVGVSRKKR